VKVAALREVIIELTKQCNLNCRHCGSGCTASENLDELSLIDWKRVVLQLYEMGVEKIVYSGGEPTLKPGFEELLVFTSALEIKTGFISNGFEPFGEDLQATLRGFPFFAVGLSIDGLKDTHNTIRGNSKSWSGLMRNIDLLQSLGKQICIITTLHIGNYAELPKLANLLEMMEIDSWQIQLAIPTGRMKEHEDLLIDEKDFRIICNMIVSLRNSFPALNIQAADCFGLAPQNSLRSNDWSCCTAGISSMAIDSHGNILPCLSMQGFPSCANIRDRTIAQIWRNADYFTFNRHFKRSDVHGLCAACKMLDSCRGGCNSLSFAYTQQLHNAPFCFYRSLCNQTKEKKP
jgi:radical SAM protein with 4Fe4S-binding SPASM domain